MDNQPPNQPPISSSAVPPTQKKLLIVEDDFFIRDLYEINAREAGFAVKTASDGQEAVTMVQAEIPDLILLDLMLPKMNGIDVVKTLKADARFAKIPIIIITNLEDEVKHKEALDAGAVEYLLKIRNKPNEVVEILKKYI